MIFDSNLIINLNMNCKQIIYMVYLCNSYAANYLQKAGIWLGSIQSQFNNADCATRGWKKKTILIVKGTNKKIIDREFVEPGIIWKTDTYQFLEEYFHWHVLSTVHLATKFNECARGFVPQCISRSCYWWYRSFDHDNLWYQCQSAT